MAVLISASVGRYLIPSVEFGGGWLGSRLNALLDTPALGAVVDHWLHMMERRYAMELAELVPLVIFVPTTRGAAGAAELARRSVRDS